ncbi:MAG: hypothetical protein AAFX50_09735, partial [Acidobacteriota bacterium]
MEPVKKTTGRAAGPRLAAALAIGLAAAAASTWTATAAPVDGAGGISPKALSGGDATVFDAGKNAFGRSLGNLEARHWSDMQKGKRLFVHRFAPPGGGAHAG